MMLALIAGQGNLPYQIIQDCQKQGRSLLVVGFEGQTDLQERLGDTTFYTEFSLGSIGHVLEHLRRHHVQEIVFAGGIRRPSWSELQLDWVGTKWLKKLGLQALKGDDDLLSGIINLLAQEGFTIVKPSDLLEKLMLPKGTLTAHLPTDTDWQDIRRGVDILTTLSSLDIGQAVIVQQGLVLGIEAIEGTQELIQRCSTLKRSGLGGVLVKTAKVQQNKAIDLPTIGPYTLLELKKAGFVGVAASAETTQVIDYEETIKYAEGCGIFVVGLSS